MMQMNCCSGWWTMAAWYGSLVAPPTVDPCMCAMLECAPTHPRSTWRSGATAVGYVGYMPRLTPRRAASWPPSPAASSSTLQPLRAATWWVRGPVRLLVAADDAHECLCAPRQTPALMLLKELKLNSSRIGPYLRALPKCSEVVHACTFDNQLLPLLQSEFWVRGHCCSRDSWGGGGLIG